MLVYMVECGFVCGDMVVMIAYKEFPLHLFPAPLIIRPSYLVAFPLSENSQDGFRYKKKFRC